MRTQLLIVFVFIWRVQLLHSIHSSCYLLHESLSQTHDFGKEDGVIGEVGAQVAQHAECVPAEVLEGLCRPRGPFVPQWAQNTSSRPFGETSPLKKKTGNILESACFSF